MAKLIKFKSQLYKRVDKLSQEEIYEAARELTELYKVLSKVYFGDIEEYLEYMAKEHNDNNYKAAEMALKEFIPAYQKFYNTLRKVRD